MKLLASTNRTIIILLIYCFLNNLRAVTAQEVISSIFKKLEISKPDSMKQYSFENQSSKLYLRMITGELKINDNFITDTYEVYFQIPIVFEEQVPILIKVSSPQLIDYRFIHLSPPNVIGVAWMEPTTSSYLNWVAWVLVKENTYSDLPDYIAMSTLDRIPDSLKQWLQSTDCVQVNASIVQQRAQEIRGDTDNLMELADDIAEFCYKIPWIFSHHPASLDAVYALKWGTSCIGRAHAGAALFRANGVPARILLNIPTWASKIDMHWNIQYYVPGYGWVRMETSSGRNPSKVEQEIVTLACNPEDEFPVFYPCGVEAHWHTSDPALRTNPQWAYAHRAKEVLNIFAASDTIAYTHSLTDSVFLYFSRYCGINLNAVQEINFQTALNYQDTALVKLKESDLEAYLANMQFALKKYQDMKIEPIATIFLDDFENDNNGWTHGGTQDEWELGISLYGPTVAHSGEKCWGIDLDGNYENNADCWLLSPLIHLEEYHCAYLSFWLWNWAQEVQGVVFVDPLWLDITSDGTPFYPLCSSMGGVNDDPEIPDVGGWTKVVLDLTRYVGNSVRIRFRFKSDHEDVQPGPYIDDVRVFGRYIKEDNSNQPKGFVLSQNYPNPFNSFTRIKYKLPQDCYVKLEVFNILGQKITTLVNSFQTEGEQFTFWDSQNLSTGVYFYRIEAGDFVEIKKCLLLK